MLLSFFIHKLRPTGYRQPLIIDEKNLEFS
jgi:hypothetical protein